MEWEEKAQGLSWAQALCSSGVCYTQLTPACSNASNRSLLHRGIPREELPYLWHVYIAVCLLKSEKGHLSSLKDSSNLFWLISLFWANLLITPITIHWNKSAFILLPCTICLRISMGLGQDAHEETVCKTHGSQQKSLMVKEVATQLEAH